MRFILFVSYDAIQVQNLAAATTTTTKNPQSNERKESKSKRASEAQSDFSQIAVSTDQKRALKSSLQGKLICHGYVVVKLSVLGHFEFVFTKKKG
jgi:hypothetical protein